MPTLIIIALRELPCAAIRTFFLSKINGWIFSVKYGETLSTTSLRLSPLGGGVSYDRLQICTCSFPNLLAVSALFNPTKSP